MENTSTAYLFPGQGSQKLGMGKDLAASYSTAREIFDQADEWLGYKLSNMVWNGPESELNDTANTQPALLVHSLAVLAVLKEKFPEIGASFIAGHSMGELSALVAVKAMEFRDALNLVMIRGKLMRKAGKTNPGGMAAILGLDITTLDQVCTEASSEENVVQIANDNCPGQVVISGSKPSLEKAVELAHRAGARKIIRLAVSIAAHSPLMKTVQDEFSLTVEDSPIKDPHTMLFGNVTAKALISAGEIRDDLKAQLTSRVRWTESIQGMIKRGATNFIEIGSGSVLTGLVKKIDRKVKRVSIGSIPDFEILDKQLQ